MRFKLGLTLIAFLAPLPLCAEEPAAEASPAGWTATLGGVAVDSPRFPGAKDMRVNLYPALELRDGDTFFASMRDGIGASLLHINGFSVGPILRLGYPRYVGDDRAALHGLADVDPTVEAGAFLRYRATPSVSAQLELRKGLNGHNGVVTEGELTFSAPPLLSHHLLLSAGPRVAYYNATYARAYYGVSQAESAASGYTAFSPSDGLKYGAGATAIYAITDHIAAGLFGNVGILAGGIANAPIVHGRYGSRVQSSIGASLTYTFGW